MKTYKPLFSIDIIVFVLVLITAIPASLAKQNICPKLEIHETTLDNGLRVILVPDHSTPIYAIAITYSVGSASETPMHTGFAHLFEHLMFQGSENVAKGEHFLLVSNNGGRMNASTGVDRTAYYEELPANELDLGLFLEADRMRSLNVTQETLDNQRNVVIEEHNRRLDNEPFGNSSVVLESLAYDQFGYKHPILGAVSDLRLATVQEAVSFFHKYYLPNNAILTLVGDFVAEDALAKIHKYFDSIPGGETPLRVKILEKPHSGERREVVKSALSRVTQIDIAYPIPPGDETTHYASEQLAILLGRGQNSLFYRRLVKEMMLASNVEVTTDSRVGVSQLYISVNPNPGVPAETVLQAIDTILGAAARNGFTEQALISAQLYLFRNVIEQRESMLSLAFQIGDYAAKFNHPKLINEIVDKQEAVNLLEVRDTAKRFLVPDQRSIVITVPANTEKDTKAGDH
jgi:predicted Zn-dependent peptidase